MPENDYFAAAFRFVRDQGFIYEGSGVYSRRGQRVRVRDFASWKADPSQGYTVSAEIGIAA